MNPIWWVMAALTYCALGILWTALISSEDDDFRGVGVLVLIWPVTVPIFIMLGLVVILGNAVEWAAKKVKT